MKNFLITLGAEEFESEGDSVLLGSLELNNSIENFQSSLSYWQREDYIFQWKEALDRILRGENKSAIVTTMYNPEKANFLFWWVIYLIKDEVYIQNHVLFLNELKEKFNENNIYKFVPSREVQNDEGEVISEWRLELSDIKQARCAL